MRTKKLIALLLLLMVSFMGLQVSFRVQAKNDFPEVTNIQYLDLNNDGSPDLAILTTTFVSYSNANDVVYVYDQNHNMIKADDWRKSCDFEDDLWIFDTCGDSRAELIIDFSKENEAQVAYLYDDVNGDGEVSFKVAGTSVNVTESPYWTLKVFARDGVWEDKGKVDYNITIFGDSNISFLNIPDEIEAGMKHDGKIDFQIEIWDVNGDGVPDYEIRGFAPKQDVLGHLFTVNNDDSPPIIGNSIFWWLLGSDRFFWNRISYSNDTAPPIQVDWSKAKIKTIKEIVPSRGGENNYFIYEAQILKNRLNVFRFAENPFAYYDLAGDCDGYPELIIRAVSLADEKDRPYYGTIRYTWDQTNDANADYGLLLVGKNYFNSIVEYPGFSIAQVPHNELPNWIYHEDRKWNVVVFTDANGEWLGLGEGIYENFLFRGLVEENFLYDGHPSLPPYIPNKVRTRAEYSVNMQGLPGLYFSPIDRRLHLQNAEGGILIISAEKRENPYGGADLSDFTKKELLTGNLSTIEKIEYRNLDGGKYINEWIYFQRDIPKKYLICSRGYLIYADSYRIKIMKTNIRESLFESMPPRDFDEWKKLDENLKKYQVKLNSTDFEAMFNQFAGKLIYIDGCKFEDFKLTDSGFRMVLELSQNHKITSDINIIRKSPLTSGRFILDLDGNFTFVELTSPILSVFNVTFNQKTPTELDNVKITAEIKNDGLIDVSGVKVIFYDGDPNRGGIMIDDKTVLIPGGSSTLIETVWIPEKEGKHDIYVVIDAENAQPRSEVGNKSAFQTINVLPVREQQPSFGIPEIPFLITFLAVLTVLLLPYLLRKRNNQ